jgi:hypothetical protein
VVRSVYATLGGQMEAKARAVAHRAETQVLGKSQDKVAIAAARSTVESCLKIQEAVAPLLRAEFTGKGSQPGVWTGALRALNVAAPAALVVIDQLARRAGGGGGASGDGFSPQQVTEWFAAVAAVLVVGFLVAGAQARTPAGRAAAGEQQGGKLE